MPLRRGGHETGERVARPSDTSGRAGGGRKEGGVGGGRGIVGGREGVGLEGASREGAGGAPHIR
jgi:hypothetical protein